MASSNPSPVALAARLALMTVCTGLLNTAPQAWAQAAPSTSNNTLAEVTVYGSSSAAHEEPPSEATRSYKATSVQSATGMALSAQETPQAITVLTRQQMDDHQLDTLSKVLDSTPGVSSSAIDRGRQRFSARGFAIDKYQVDGLSVNWSGPWAAGEALADTVLYDRVEVVRGATGLLNGAGQPSASVNLVRKRAHNRQRSTVLAAGLESEKSLRATLDHSQPLNADASVRGRFVLHQQGGDTFIAREKSRQGALYGVIDADFSPATRASLGLSHQHTRKNSAMWGGLPTLFDDGQLTNWPRSMNSSANWVYWNTGNTNLFFDSQHRFDERWSLSLKANQRRFDSRAALFYFSGNTVNRADGLGWSPWPGKFSTEGKQNTAQLQLDGQFDAWGQRHDVVAGLQYNKQRRTSRSATGNTNIAPASNFFAWDGSYPEPTWGGYSLSLDQIDTESALYAAARMRVSKQLSVIAGSRLSRWKSHGTSSGKPFEHRPGSVWTPYAAVLYDFTAEHTAYASYTSIFKPQNERDIHNQLLAPIEGKNYEIGLKSSWLGGELDTQISLFRTLQENLAQRTDAHIPGVEPATYAYRAAKGAKTRGFEAEAAGRITSHLQLGGGYSQWRGQDADGTALNTTEPRRQFKLFASYDAQRLLPGLTLGGSINWQSRIYTRTSNRATGGNIEYGQNAYALLGLMARYQLSPQLSGQLNIDNLLNKKYINQLSFNQYGYGDPRR
ncbi:MAG: TonB-dependent siderophore receptor, partial [Comamonadaceae bacterium]|nr:TonB-dependent siderophore receptor [Comamonadaceae bacterium]